jgi:NAD+ kinase
MNFKQIGIVGKTEPKALETISSLVEYLVGQQINLAIETNTYAKLEMKNLEALDLEALCQKSDLIIVVGGDGTLLGTARIAVSFDTPVLGINLGRLGFLVDILPDAMCDSLDKVLAGQYETDDRLLLELKLQSSDSTSMAFNDVVVHKWNTARLIEFETFINGQFVDRQRSDGLIMATPTGSTAYALSGGGPLLYPGLDAISIVPICPHTLSNRPIVVPADSQIEIRVCGHTPIDELRISCDGQETRALSKGTDRIFIQKHQKKVRLIHPPEHDHFHILRKKLGWGTHHSN